MYKARVANIADRIGEALKARQMRPSALCKVAKIPQSSLSLYLSGAYEPKQDRVYAMASALNVDVAWLLGYDVQMGTFADNTKEENETVSEELTPKERQLLELFRLLTDEEQEHVLQTAKMIAK
jgi:transcriptional regulator with XRE-family HTH domain